MTTTLRPTPYTDALSVQLHPFQRVGVEWLASQPTAFLGDQMGTGKSAQAIRAADAVEAQRILVTAPTNAVYNWRGEFRKFSRYARTTHVVDAGHVVIDPSASVVVVTHGLLKRESLRRQMAAQRWDLVIADEAHAFKHASSKRTHVFYGPNSARDPGSIAALAPRVWLLSGTPAENHGGELWTHVHALRPDLLLPDGATTPLSYDGFTKRYCIVKLTGYGPKVVGNRQATLPELRDKVIRPFVLRRLLATVVPEMPPIRYEAVIVPPDHVPADLRALESELGDAVLNAMANIDAGVDPLEVLRCLDAQESAKDGGISRLRRLTGHLKVRPTIALLSEHFHAYPDRKVLVAARHLAVVEEIVEQAEAHGWSPARITGAVSAFGRHQAVERFQTDPRCKVFVGQITACATAATLTAANEVVFAEASWVPAENAQFAARAWRIGQKNDVRVRLLALAGSIDEAVMDVLVRKVRVVKELLG